MGNEPESGSTDNSANDDVRVSLGGELILPIMALVFTLYYFSTIVDSPWTAQVNAFMVGSLLISVIVLFLLRMAIMVSRGEADLGLGNLLQPAKLLPSRLIYIVLIVLYLLGIEWGGGFTISTFLFLLCAMLLLNKGKDKAFVLGLSAGLALLGYGVFIIAFETRFPAGPFEKLMQGVF